MGPVSAELRHFLDNHTCWTLRDTRFSAYAFDSRSGSMFNSMNSVKIFTTQELRNIDQRLPVLLEYFIQAVHMDPNNNLVLKETLDYWETAHRVRVNYRWESTPKYLTKLHAINDLPDDRRFELYCNCVFISNEKTLPVVQQALRRVDTSLTYDFIEQHYPGKLKGLQAAVQLGVPNDDILAYLASTTLVNQQVIPDTLTAI